MSRVLLLLSVLACVGLCAGPAANAAVPVAKKRTVCKKRVVRTASGKKKTVKRCYKVRVKARSAAGTAPLPVSPEPEAPAPAYPTAPAPDGIRGQLRECANSERAKVGLKPLADDPVLSVAAQAHVVDMKTRNYFAHESLDGKSPFDRIDGVFASIGLPNTFTAMGENIAKGFTDAATVCKAWMESPGHRANILRPEFTYIGTGWIDGYAGQEFGGR